MFIVDSNLLTCITVSVSACCILLRIALRIWSRFSPSSFPALEINVETNLPTKAAVNSEVRGSRSWLTTCITYHSPLWPCSSCHCAICSRATEMYARRHSPPFCTNKNITIIHIFLWSYSPFLFSTPLTVLQGYIQMLPNY